MDLKGKTAVVTGGAVRLGAEISKALAARECNVVIHCNRSVSAAGKLSLRFRQSGVQSFVVKGDISTERGCRKVLSDARRMAGRLDILVNNAAVFHSDGFAGITERKVLRELRINLLAPMLLTREFARQTAGGKVINLLDQRIASNETGCLPYLLSKKALADVTRVAALELAPGITVNAVAPGPVLPPVDGGIDTARRKAGRLPLRRRPAPVDVAGAVTFLLEADAITGQIIFVDGGQHLLGSA